MESIEDQWEYKGFICTETKIVEMETVSYHRTVQIPCELPIPYLGDYYKLPDRSILENWIDLGCPTDPHTTPTA